MRTLGLRRVAEQEADALAAELREALEAFCAGVNAPRLVPGRCLRAAAAAPGLRAWRPADMLALVKLLAFGLSTNWERELLRADMVRGSVPS